MSDLGAALFTVFGMIQSLNVLGTEVDVRVKPGDDVILYCDCSWTFGSQIYWYRNCSHDGQPTLVISPYDLLKGIGEASLSCYESRWNASSNSHDLVVKNITESQVGLYYCSVTTTKVTDNKAIQQTKLDIFGNITYKLSIEDPAPPPPPVPECGGAGQCWMLLVCLCPVCALLSAFISATCVYCCKTGSNQDQRRGDRFQVGLSLPKKCLRSLEDQDDVYTEVTYKQL